MVQAVTRCEPEWSEPPLRDPPGLMLSMAVFADRPRVRTEIAEDGALAGLRPGQVGELAVLCEGEPAGLGDVVLVDVPVVTGTVLAALARIDLRAAHAGAQVVVSTALPALDDVFACLESCGAQILVEPTRGERIVALGRAVAALPRGRVRELSEDDRLAMLRLTEQVAQLAERIDRLSGDASGSEPSGSVFRFESPVTTWRGADEDGSARLVRAPRPALPDPRLLRRIIRQRQLRARYFDADLFADPAWDILLDLAAARAEHKRVSVTSLCIASGVPPTTALRWIAQMTDSGLLERIEDDADRRRAFIALSDRAAEAMSRYFAELGRGSERLV